MGYRGQTEEEEERDRVGVEGEGGRKEGMGRWLMNVRLFPADCLWSRGGSGWGSVVRKTDRMASMTSHMDPGEENSNAGRKKSIKPNYENASFC